MCLLLSSVLLGELYRDHLNEHLAVDKQTTCGDERLRWRAAAITVLGHHFDLVLTGTQQPRDRTSGTEG